MTEDELYTTKNLRPEFVQELREMEQFFCTKVILRTEAREYYQKHKTKLTEDRTIMPQTD